MKAKLSVLISTALYLLIFSCSNNPYPKEDLETAVLFRAYSTPLKYVDPVKSYYSYEASVIDQIYEPLFQYHYLKRPYELIPCAAESVPSPVNKSITIKEAYSPRRFDAQGNEILRSRTVEAVSYTIRIKKDLWYAPNECFPTNTEKGYRSRRVTANDFLYAFKRIADPGLSCPVFPVLVPKIYGLTEFYEYNSPFTVTVREGDTLASLANKYYGDPSKASLLSVLNNKTADKDLIPGKTDLNIIRETDYSFPVSGIIIHDEHTIEILMKEPYPQILYWMAMHFTAPMPEEAVRASRKRIQAGLSEELRLTQPAYLDWPVGTGAYTMSEWKPRREIILKRNPLFRKELYPSEGAPGDLEAGLLKDAGKPMPFIDKIIFRFDKETITVWNKFIQGYLDSAGVPKEHFDRVITEGRDLSGQMKDRGIRLEKAVASDIFYYGFNMLDPVVGGYSQKKKYLRRALAKALNVPLYIKIFRNNRGIIPSSPVPPGIFGHIPNQKGLNTYDLKEAEKLLALAGYPNGIDPETGKPLEIVYDNAGTSSAARANQIFFKENLECLGIKVKIESTDLNTYRRKIYDGNYQIFESGWLLDYPDPENFLFLLYGPNGTVKYGADNRANYASLQYDTLFRRIETMENSSSRKALIRQMSEIAEQDCPWIYLFHSMDFYLLHKWYGNVKVTDLINNNVKYKSIDPSLRKEYIRKHNKPVYWPILLITALFFVSLVPAYRAVRKKYK